MGADVKNAYILTPTPPMYTYTATCRSKGNFPFEVDRDAAQFIPPHSMVQDII
jgi:hypothetical protein